MPAKRIHLGLPSNYAISAAEQMLKQRKAGHAPIVDAVAKYEKGDNDALGFSNPSATGQSYGGNVEQTSVSLQLNTVR